MAMWMERLTGWLGKLPVAGSVETTKTGWYAVQGTYQKLFALAAHALKAALLVFGLFIVAQVIHNQFASGFVMKPFAVVSESLNQHGLGSDVTTAIVTERIQLLRRRGEEYGGLSAEDSRLRGEQKAEIAIPGTGIKLDEFVSLMGQVLPFGPRSISVSINESTEQLNATVRVRGRPLKILFQPKQATVATTALQHGECCETAERCLLRRIAEYLTAVVDPVAMALNYRVANDHDRLSELLREYRLHEFKGKKQQRVQLGLLQGIREMTQLRTVGAGNEDGRDKIRRKASATFNEVLKRDHDNALAYKLLADLMPRNKQHEDTDRFFARAFAASGNDIAIGKRWAYHLAKTKRPEDSDKKFAELLASLSEDDPRHGKLMLLWAEALRDSDRYTEAAEKYQRAMELQPGDAMLHASHGTYFLQQKDYRRAREEFLLADRNSQELPAWALINMASTHSKLGENRAALRAFERAAVIGLPNWAQQHWFAALEAADKQIDTKTAGRRLASLQRYLSRFPTDAAAHKLHIPLLLRQMVLSQPVAPQLPGLEQGSAGEAERSLVLDIDVAIRAGLRAIDGSGDEPEYLFIASRSLRKAGKPELGLLYADEALQINPHYHSGYIEKATSLAVLGEGFRAQRVIEAGAAMLQEPPAEQEPYGDWYQSTYYLNAGRLMRRHVPTAALDLLQRAERIDNWSQWITLHQVSTLLELNQLQDARNKLKPVLDIITGCNSNPSEQEHKLWLADSERGKQARAGAYFRLGLLELSESLCNPEQQQDRLQQAAKAFGDALETNPRDAGFYPFALATSLMLGDSNRIESLLMAAERLRVSSNGYSQWQQFIDKHWPELPATDKIFESKLLKRPERCDVVVDQASSVAMMGDSE